MKAIKWIIGSLLFVMIMAFVVNNPELAEDGDPVCKPPVFLVDGSGWADSLVESMTLDEKIGQLFMVAAYSNQDDVHQKKIESLIDDYKIGGLIFMQGDPISQANLTNIYQEKSNIPLLIAMDAEWGLGMRLKNTTSFPRQMAMGAMGDSMAVYDFGAELARECKRLGVHVSFSPVVDVNNNSNNPVINNRSFGEDKELVTRYGLAYMNGLQDNGVLACAKHFPGHGDTDVDSHLDLPVINHSLTRLKDIELYPFEQMVHQGLGSLMIAHLFIPALDNTKNLPSTLSKPIVTDLLRNDMFFEGLIFTDAMNMQGVAKYFKPGEKDVLALAAGNDILLIPENVPVTVAAIKKAIADSVLLEEFIDEKVRRILQVKEWSGAKDFERIEPEGIVADLTNAKSEVLRKEIIEKSLTVLENKNDILPLIGIENKKIATLTFGDNLKNPFNEKLSEYIDFSKYSLAKNPSFDDSKRITDKLAEYDIVIINMLGATNRLSKNYGVSVQSMIITNSIAKNSEVILNVFANPYALKKVPKMEVNSLTIAYHDTKMTQEAVVDMMMGSIGASGKLPVTASSTYVAGLGLELDNIVRLQMVDPAYFDIDKKKLAQIDAIVKEGIKEQAFPGCRVLAIKDGKIFLDKSYGYMTYEEKQKVDLNTIYDIASITKISATVPALMKLEGEDLFEVNAKLGEYYTMPDSSDYNDLIMKEMLAHYAQLKPWIPFYMNTISEGKLDENLYRKTSHTGYSTMVAPEIYIKDTYRDSIFDRILDNDFLSKKKYRYSDLGYYFFKEIVEDISDKKMEDYVEESFYSPLGLRTLGYNPLIKNEMDDIAPTEYDLLYRRQVVRGYVHDPGAAMLGGVGGHAGVFSNAYDLGVLMQMYLNGGEYGGVRVLEEHVLDKYTSCPFCSDRVRRGIGFDKPTFNLDSGASCNSASKFSFGHSGFTGTLVWADPEHDLIFVFLSNRVYPNAENRKLLDMDIRTNIQQVLYDCFDIPSRKAR